MQTGAQVDRKKKIIISQTKDSKQAAAKGEWNKKHDPALCIGKDSNLKMSNNMADEAAAIHVQKQCA